MVAYSFQKRFAPGIEAHTKRQTIRGDRKRHARPYERVQLYQGMRTRYCRKIIPDPVCTLVRPITLWVPTKLEPVSVSKDGKLTYVTDDFAVADGFEDVEDFTRFWFDTHGPGFFYGVTVAWDPLTSEVPDGQ